MSRVVCLFLERAVSKEELYLYLQSTEEGLQTDASEQITVTRSDGTVRCCYLGNEFNLDAKSRRKLEKCGASWNTEVTVEFGREEGSSGLAEELCERILHEYGNCILYSDDGNFYGAEQLHRVICEQDSCTELSKGREGRPGAAGDPVSWKKILHGICIFIIAMWWFVSCQRRSGVPNSVIVYYGPSAYTEVDQLLENGSYEEALELCMNDLEEAQKGSNKEIELDILIGEIYGSYLGDREQAVSYLRQAIATARKNKNQSGLADACYGMSNVYVNLGGDMEEGLKYAREAEELYRNELGECAMETADAISNQGILYYNEEQWENALEKLELAEEIYESGQTVDWSTCIRIGMASMKLQKFEQAEESILKAKEVSQEAGNDYYSARSSHWLAEVYVDMEEYRQAIDSYEEALNFYETDTQHPIEKAQIYNNSAYCMIQESGNWEEGILYGIRACQVLEETEDVSEEVKEARERYKQRLKERYYDQWKPDSSDEEFEVWYQRVVLDGEEWNPVTT